MKRSLMDIICCPVCKGELILTVERENEEVLEGILRCEHCRVQYPIHEGIPNLLPPSGH